MKLVHFESLFSEIALRNVHMFFRSNPIWSVVEPLRNIGEFPYICSPRQKSRPLLLVPGWRFRKQYYLIVSKTDSKLPKHLLSWVRCCRVGCT